MHAMPASLPAALSPVAAAASAQAVDAGGGAPTVIEGEIAEQVSFDQVLAAQVLGLGVEAGLTPDVDESSAAPDAEVLPEFLMAQLVAEIGLVPPVAPQGLARSLVELKNVPLPQGSVVHDSLALDDIAQGAGKGRSEISKLPLDSFAMDELMVSSGVLERSAAGESVGGGPGAVAELSSVDALRSALGSAAGTDAPKSQGVSRPAEGFNPRHIPEPVKSPAWSEALGQRVVWMAKENVQVVHLQLEPPNLGPVEVQLILNRDQASLVFVSSHASVREAISDSLSKLNDLLSAGGVSLGSVSVNTQSQADQHAGSGGHPGEGAGDWFSTDALAEAPHLPARVALGLVDTFA